MENSEHWQRIAAPWLATNQKSQKPGITKLHQLFSRECLKLLLATVLIAILPIKGPDLHVSDYFDSVLLVGRRLLQPPTPSKQPAKECSHAAGGEHRASASCLCDGSPTEWQDLHLAWNLQQIFPNFNTRPGLKMLSRKEDWCDSMCTSHSASQSSGAKVLSTPGSTTSHQAFLEAFCQGC